MAMATISMEQQRGNPIAFSMERYDAQNTIAALQKQVRSLKRRLQNMEKENQTLVSRMNGCKNCHKIVLTGKLSPQCKANWSDEFKKAFIDICLDEARKGNRPSSSFSRSGWINITERFNEYKGTKYVKGQFKNLYAVVRDSWKEWKCLVNRSNGWGWDPVSQTVDCDPQIWEEYCKSHKHAKQFSSRPLLFEEELDELFGGAGPRDGETLDVAAYKPLCSVMVPERTEPEPVRARPPRPFVPRKRKKGRIVTVASVASPPPSATEVIRLLDGVDGLEVGGEFYLRALKILRGPTEREFFVAMDPRVRLAWLHSVVNGEKPF